MKKIASTILLIVCISTVTHAQLNLGLKLNWNINKFIIHNSDANVEFYNNGIYGLNSLTLSGGIMANYRLSKQFSLQSELIYNSINTGFGKAEHYTDNQGDLDIVGNDFQVQTHYLEIPLLAKISFGNKVTFDILAGAYAGYLLSAKQSTSDGRLYMPQQNSIDYPPHNVRSDYTSFNGGIVAGLGVTMKDRMVFEFRLNRGLVDINKSSSEKFNTLQGQFTVGYYLFRQKAKVNQ